MSKPKISVSIATYNSQDTIEKTLDSVASQTFTDFEIVLSDDGSKDNTVIVVNKWKERHPDISMSVVAKPKNEGTVKNVNTTFKLARAELIKDLGGDDILLPNALEEFYKAYQENPDVIWHCVPDYDCDNEDDLKALEASFDERRDFFKKTAWQQHSTFLTTNPIISIAVGLIPKAFCEKVGYFDTKYVLMEDYPFYERLSKNGIRFELLDKKLCKYVVRSDSVTHSCNMVYEGDKLRHFLTELLPQLLLANRKSEAVNLTKYYIRKYRENKKASRKNK